MKIDFANKRKWTVCLCILFFLHTFYMCVWVGCSMPISYMLGITSLSPHPSTHTYTVNKRFLKLLYEQYFCFERTHKETTTKHIQFIGLHTILHTQTTSWKNHFSFLLLRLFLLPVCTKINSPLTNVTVTVVSCSWTSKSVQHDFLEAEYFILHSKDTNNVRSCDTLYFWKIGWQGWSSLQQNLESLFKKRRNVTLPDTQYTDNWSTKYSTLSRTSLFIWLPGLPQKQQQLMLPSVNGICRFTE